MIMVTWGNGPLIFITRIMHVSHGLHVDNCFIDDIDICLQGVTVAESAGTYCVAHTWMIFPYS